MVHKQGFTLMEIIVVLIIVGIVIAAALPNFITPTEQAKATNVRNNLLAIYSAEQNYNNNNGSYYLSPSLTGINSNLSLNIQDDGAYSYICAMVSGTPTCTATRNGTPSTNIVLALNAAIQLNGNVNPKCNTANNWCP